MEMEMEMERWRWRWRWRWTRDGGSDGGSDGDVPLLVRFIVMKVFWDFFHPTVYTIHQAKGLQWSHVFLVSMLEGVCPSHPVDQIVSAEGAEHMEEERR